MKAITYDDDEPGHDVRRCTTSRATCVKTAEAARFHLLESIAEYDEQLLDDYLHEKPYTSDDLRRALRKGTLAGAINPVLCGSAFKNKGVQRLLDAVVDFLPSPLDKPPVEGQHADTFEHIDAQARPTTSRSRRWRSRS